MGVKISLIISLKFINLLFYLFASLDARCKPIHVRGNVIFQEAWETLDQHGAPH